MRERALREGRKRAGETFLDDRLTRLLVSIVLSLSVFIALAELPIYVDPGRVGWQFRSGSESFSLEVMSEREEELSDPRISSFEASAMIDRDQPPEDKESETEGEDSLQANSSVDPDTVGGEADPGSLAEPLEIFELSGNEPSVAGGMGSLYMQVNYPMAARQQGIEGRVILTFIVDEEGNAHEIEVMQSAHPMLDSAAVRAVRHTRFVPGRHEGDPVPVRMRLPIRFQLVSGNEK